MSNERSTPTAGPGQPRAEATSGRPQPAHGLSLIAIFTLTTFLSALLLFSIQPLFARMVLPLLGGSPSVWAVALCFFQGALLAGYCYAHVLNHHVPVRYVGFVHLAVFALAMMALPIGLPAAWKEPPPGDPYMWQLGLFSVAVGLPFIAVAANAPLLQAWFARTGHPDGRDPYFLYGASNLGSFFALIAYPLLLEPAFGVSSLSRQWTIGFVLLGLAIGVCFWRLRESPSGGEMAATDDASAATASAPAAAPTWADKLGWIGLALVPSALLTAFTTHVATDVASAPLIWVVPLALYLLTFVLVFRDKPIVLVPCAVAVAAGGYILVRSLGQRMGWTLPGEALAVGAMACVGVFVWLYNRGLLPPTRWLLGFHLAAVILALLQLSQTRHDTWFVSAATGVTAFFLAALVAHRTLYEARPAARYLTAFYLWMSFGGVLGGLFAALVAPQIFPEIFEYPILLALTMACRPGAGELFRMAGSGLASLSRSLRLPVPQRWSGLTSDTGNELLRLWIIAAVGILVVWWSQLLDIEARLREAAYWLETNYTLLGIGDVVGGFLRWLANYGIAALLALLFAAAVVAFIRYPARQFVAAMLMCFAVVMLPSSVKRGDAQRSFFGVYRVSESYDKEFQILTHGTTLHGAQRIRDNVGALVVDTTPGTYYHPKSPMARTVELVRERATADGVKGRFGVVGVGTGSLACFAQEGERWRFFEIDPVIIEIATNAENFSFINKCQPKFDYVLGDARLTLAKEEPKSFDLIIVDAFSSDAVPVHLMTAEAMRIYASKIDGQGRRAVAHLQPLSRSRRRAGGDAANGAGARRADPVRRRCGRQLRVDDVDGRRVLQEQRGAGGVPQARHGVRAEGGRHPRLDGRLLGHPRAVHVEAEALKFHVAMPGTLSMVVAVSR